MRTGITGGCLDGGTAEIVSGSTYQCRESSTFYAIDDDTGLLVFTGHGPYGREMALIMSGMRWDARAEQAAIEEAQRPRSCPGGCGRVFAGGGALAVHRDAGRCLPDHMTESLLVVVDGVYVLRGSDAARR